MKLMKYLCTSKLFLYRHFWCGFSNDRRCGHDRRRKNFKLQRVGWTCGYLCLQVRITKYRTDRFLYLRIIWGYGVVSDRHYTVPPLRFNRMEILMSPDIFQMGAVKVSLGRSILHLFLSDYTVSRWRKQKLK